MRILMALLLLVTPVLAQEAPPAVPSTSVKLDGEVWTQKPQKYHARSLAMLRAKYAEASDKAALDPLLAQTGCLEGLRS